MEFHAETIRLVQDHCMQNGISSINSALNSLYGIWDGYLYDELPNQMKELNPPVELLGRVEETIRIINEDVAEYGESYTEV